MVNKQPKGAIEPNDALNQTQVFFDKHKKTIAMAFATLIVVVVGAFLYKAYVAHPHAEKASTELGKGQQYFNMNDYEKALNGDKGTYAGFIKIASDYSGTDAGNLANLYAGLCYANLNKWKQAVKYLDAYDSANDALVSPAAMGALGNAYAHVNELDKAVDCLKKAAKMADSKADDGFNYGISPTFLLQAGKLLESQNKKSDALEIYQDIKKKYVNAMIVQNQEIDKYIERASR